MGIIWILLFKAGNLSGCWAQICEEKLLFMAECTWGFHGVGLPCSVPLARASCFLCASAGASLRAGLWAWPGPCVFCGWEIIAAFVW